MPAPIVIRDARGRTEDNGRGLVASMAMLTAYSSFMPKEDILRLFKKQHVATYAEGQTERVLVAERAGMLVGVADLMPRPAARAGPRSSRRSQTPSDR